MLNQMLLLFVGFFAIVGLITILYAIIESISQDTKFDAPCEIVLFTKNCENDIEGVIRRLSGQLSSGLSGVKIDNIAVIDYNSTDQTSEILSKLNDDISILKVYKKDEYINHIKNFI